MDILHLLEVLRPSDHVVTVKIDDNETFSKVFLGVLIAVSPVFIAAVSLYLSARQFKASLTQQMENFEKGYEQQAKVAQLTARLATEAEIKKEWCRDVRKLCVEMMAHGAAGYQANATLKLEKKEIVDSYSSEYRNELKERIRQNFDQMIELFTYLKIYLDDDEHRDDKRFFIVLDKYCKSCLELKVSPVELGRLRGLCIAACRENIDKKMREITDIALAISLKNC